MENNVLEVLLILGYLGFSGWIWSGLKWHYRDFTDHIDRTLCEFFHRRGFRNRFWTVVLPAIVIRLIGAIIWVAWFATVVLLF